MACCSAASTVVRGRPSLLQRWQLLAHNELMIGQGSFLTQREGHIVRGDGHPAADCDQHRGQTFARLNVKTNFSMMTIPWSHCA